MRIIVLTILFAGVIFYLKKEEKIVYPEKVDSIKVKISAPNRHERAPAISEVMAAAPPEALVALSETDQHLTDEKPELTRSVDADIEHVEPFQWTDLEEGWNTELKDMLSRLEPAEGEAIHKNYLQEQESYQAELESLMSEKQQKTTPEANLEVDQLIGQLEDKHQAKLKEILGAHYEAVRDGYESYMEQSQPE